MRAYTYSDVREHLRERMDQVHDDREPILITRQNAPAAVLVDAAEFDALMTTVHLLRSPANAGRLAAAIAEADAGELAERDLIDR